MDERWDIVGFLSALGLADVSVPWWAYLICGVPLWGTYLLIAATLAMRARMPVLLTTAVTAIFWLGLLYTAWRAYRHNGHHPTVRRPTKTMIAGGVIATAMIVAGLLPAYYIGYTDPEVAVKAREELAAADVELPLAGLTELAQSPPTVLFLLFLPIVAIGVGTAAWLHWRGTTGWAVTVSSIGGTAALFPATMLLVILQKWDEMHGVGANVLALAVDGGRTGWAFATERRWVTGSGEATLGSLQDLSSFDLVIGPGLIVVMLCGAATWLWALACWFQANYEYRQQHRSGLPWWRA